jgi:TonB family protein
MKQSQSKAILLKYNLILLLAVFSTIGRAQTTQPEKVISTQDSSEIYQLAEKMPEFPGGEKALLSFINQNIKYPDKSKKKNEQGKVIVQFVVGVTGKVEQPKVLRGVSPSLDKEALRVVAQLPAWIPGEQNGSKVAVYRVLPIMFQNVSEEDSWSPNEKTVVVIDSVRMPSNFEIGVLNSEKLGTVNVFKPFPKEEKNRLVKKYGKNAANGVIIIITKKDELLYSMADTTSNEQNPDCGEEAKIPEFQGGKSKLLSYIADSLQYPFVAKQLKTQGKVFVQFLVDKTGKVSQGKVIKSVDYFLDKEALRIVNSMPDWIPGSKCDEKLNIVVIMPVNFKLDIPLAEKGWEINEKTVIMLNGERLPSVFKLEWVNYSYLSSYKVLQPESKEITKKLVRDYGKDAENGVVLIETEK